MQTSMHAQKRLSDKTIAIIVIKLKPTTTEREINDA